MAEITIKDVINIPYDKARLEIVDFIKKSFDGAYLNKAVIGLSGGVDSSTVLVLLVEALGSENVVALIMPDLRINDRRDIEDSLKLAEYYSVEYYLINIDRIVDSYTIIPFYDQEHRIVNGNLRARIRMNILYYYANKYNGLVVGTSDRSELLIGYYTKYGDGAVDILPIGALYKTQVRKLAEKLGLPRRIVEKPSSPGFWVGHLAEDEIGIKYEVIDVVLYALFDKGLKPEEVPRYTGIDQGIVNKILDMHRRSRHKRVFPPMPRLSWVGEPIKEI